MRTAVEKEQTRGTEAAGCLDVEGAGDGKDSNVG